MKVKGLVSGMPLTVFTGLAGRFGAPPGPL
jgi:hypothetical protein